MSDQQPLLIQHLLGMYAMNAMAVGRASGALEVLLDAPGTATEIAAKAQLEERNVAQWLRAMTAAGHAIHDDGTFSINPETAMIFAPEFPADARVVLDFVHASFGKPFQVATEAMRTGAGVPPEVYSDLSRAAGGVNTPAYRMALVQEWIAAAPEVRSRLEAGGRVADLACGNADAAAIIATAFPLSHVVGYDPSTAQGVHADVANLEIVREVADGLPADGDFDLITCLDALHHLGDVAAACRQAYAALKRGGVFLVAETAMTGDLEVDNADPFALVAHTAGLLYCLQENLANGGDGSTPSVGLAWVEDALAAAGFAEVTQLDSETGYRIFLATR